MRFVISRPLNFTLLSTVAALLIVAASVNAQTFEFDVIDDTTLLRNGTLADSEDNFGGRNELIGNFNNSNPREILLRFDVSAAAALINDPSLIVTEASLILNPRDEKSGSQPSAGFLDVHAMVSENEGWREGTKAGSSGGNSGQFGAVSYRFLSTPSSVSTSTIDGSPLPDPTVNTDGTQWFSQGGGATTDPLATTMLEVGVDTTVDVLGTGDLSTLDAGGDSDWVISLDGPTLNPFMEEWLNAPLMGDDDPDTPGMQTSNAGLYIAPQPGSPSGQAFFESIEGRTEEAARLSITFGSAPVPGDVNDSGFANDLDFEIIRKNFWQSFTERGEGDLVNNDFIDFADYGQWKLAAKAPDPLQSGNLTQVPEPSTLAILAFAGLAGLRLRNWGK